MYPETSSDSASAKSKGARLTSNKNAIIIRPNILKNKNINQLLSCNVINTEKLKDSAINTIFNINKPKNISKFDTNKQARTDASTEYLFLLKYPVRITQKLKTNESKEA